MIEDDCRVRCEITLRFPSDDIAGKVFHAVEQDNAGFVNAERDEDTIVATIEATTLKSLLHTLDDLLSCVSVAERIVSKDE
jgi:tRNA threonylcarbamoyladenosine modification (KEOPS) complex  Pcc1 subunit